MARILIGNIKGPQGDRGQQGERGPQGAQGVPGTTPALVNNALATQSGVAALDAVMGKTLMDKLNAISRQMSRYNVEGIGIETNEMGVIKLARNTEGSRFGVFNKGISVKTNTQVATVSGIVLLRSTVEQTLSVEVTIVTPSVNNNLTITYTRENFKAGEAKSIVIPGVNIDNLNTSQYIAVKCYAPSGIGNVTVQTAWNESFITII